MVRLEDVSEAERKLLLSLPCDTFETNPWASGPPLKERRVAIVENNACGVIVTWLEEMIVIQMAFPQMLGRMATG